MAKGEQTRARIIEHALDLFSTRGYAETTLRDIADAAGVSIGLAYRYFDRKEELALALYERLSEEVARKAKLPDGTVGERWAALERTRFKVLGPHRRTLLALVQAAFDPESDLGVLSPATARVRDRWHGLHRAVVEGAALRVPASDLAQLLYAIDLLLVVFWIQDRSKSTGATNAVIDRVANLIDLAVSMPGIAGAITQLASSFQSLTASTPAKTRVVKKPQEKSR